MSSGAQPMEEDLSQFTIITTGLGFAQTNEGCKEINEVWLDFVETILLASIPANFKNIDFIHFDHLIDIPSYNKRLRMEQLRQIISITEQESKYSNGDREITSMYAGKGFEYTDCNQFESHPHMIIDLAHILKYNKDGSVSFSNHYKELSVDDPILNMKFQMNVGYIGHPCNNDIFNHLFKLQWFLIHPDGKVITYINKFLEHNVMFDTYAPEVFIKKLVESFYIHYTFHRNKSKYMHVDIIYHNKEIMNQIAETILSLIMEDEIKDIKPLYYSNKLIQLMCETHPNVKSKIEALYNEIDSKIN
jgi:hypothetical protein